MKLKLTGIALAVAFAFATAAQAQMTQTPAGKPDATKPRTEQPTRKVHNADEERIESEYKAAKEKCDALKGNQKDICVTEAKGKQKVAKAENDAKTAKDPVKAQSKVEEAKAEAAYDVAKQRCDEMKGNEKDVCMKQAKVELDRAKAKTAKTEAAREPRAGAGQTAPAAPEKPKRSY
jgi:hypothetical protein